MRWAKVPKSAVIRLTPAHLRVYAALGVHADENGECYPSQSTIAAMLGVSVRTLQRHLDEIESSGFVVRLSRKGTSNAYRLTDGEGGTTVSVTPDTQCHPRHSVSGGYDTQCQGGVRHSVSGGYDSECQGGTTLSVALTPHLTPNSTPHQQTKSTAQGDVRSSSAKKTRARRPTFSTLADALSETHGPSGLTYRDHFESKFNPPLDGRGFRPTVADELESAWNHVARKKRTDTLGYLDNWLRRAAQQNKPSYDRDQRFAPQGDDANGWERDAQRALEEMGHG